MKKKNRNKTRKRRSLQPLTLCISTAMVLVLLGLVVLSGMTAHNLTSHIRENLTVTIILSDELTLNDSHEYTRRLYHREYTKHADFISKKEALDEWTDAMGTDPSEFIGSNPFMAAIEVQLKSDYACHDSLIWIERQIRKDAGVTDVTYREDLVDSVNRNVRKLSMVLIALAVLLFIVSFSLISNTVRLGVYARRFTIRTMKLVGASWRFIRWPFIRQSLVIALIASLLASVAMCGLIYALFVYEPAAMNFIDWKVLTITGISIWVLGFALTLLCTYLSVNKFLHMSAGELYKV